MHTFMKFYFKGTQKSAQNFSVLGEMQLGEIDLLGSSIGISYILIIIKFLKKKFKHIYFY